jgi:hypothetical protein
MFHEAERMVKYFAGRMLRKGKTGWPLLGNPSLSATWSEQVCAQEIDYSDSLAGFQVFTAERIVEILLGRPPSPENSVGMLFPKIAPRNDFTA